MEKQKRWQLYLILAVICLTLYNILPTIFYYTKPLKKPIDEKESVHVAQDIATRVNSLEDFTLSWLRAQCDNLHLKPTAIVLDKQDPRIARVQFKKAADAQLFARTLPRAGALIPFVPAQLTSVGQDTDPNTVIIQRRIGLHFDPDQLSRYFQFVPKTQENGAPSLPYRQLIGDRAAQIALGFGGESTPARILLSLSAGNPPEESLLALARSVVEYENTFGDQSPVTKRYFASFTRGLNISNKQELIQQFTSKLGTLSQQLQKYTSSLQEEQMARKKEGKFLTSDQQQQLEIVSSQRLLLDTAAAIVKRNTALFASGEAPLSESALLHTIGISDLAQENIQTIPLGQRNSFVHSLRIDWQKETIQIVLHPDIQKMRALETKNERDTLQAEKLNHLIFTEIAATARRSGETISPFHSDFIVSLNHLTNSSSMLVFNIEAAAKAYQQTLSSLLTSAWQPIDPDLTPQNYPIHAWDHFQTLSAPQQQLGLVIYSPSTTHKGERGFRHGTMYVIARGLRTIWQKYADLPASSQKEQFEKDFSHLQDLMRQNGFIGYPGNKSGLPSKFHNDYIFELDDYYSYLLAASRENFTVQGSKKYAILEFTDVEQRILTKNKIDTRIHEDLLKWRDEYRQAKVSLRPESRYDVPPPTKNVLWDNLKLSFKKYFRGDERKVLKWGLDLSGGKTVRIGLKNKSNQTITDENDLKQAASELYQRVNRLGLSEVGLRTEGSTIVLDFPGSQGLAASELIQASAMYFHVVNEKFTPQNPLLSEAAQAFLEEVWSEAVITNRTDTASINEIAWSHLGGNSEKPDEFHPLTSHAQLLYTHGLRLASPSSPAPSSTFDDTLSAVTRFRGSDTSDWQGQTHPLLLIFRNYALEGANLTNVQAGYDPAEGNTLYFGIKTSYHTRAGDKVNPRDDFYAWTAPFSEEKVLNTPLEAFSQRKGWRMAVILNDTIVSAPNLHSPLRDSARISGHFSQREINQLAADLKAGSMSFTPHILSEENVSPDLGKEQRRQGVSAALLGLTLVILAMCFYYRFSGVVASIAVLFNLLILWGVLQNLGAALTLPGIAGIILAVGMSVDANVLVFERIREEFALTGRLPSAVRAGYRKAFTAIIDSNLTTIIAAVILLNFDSGPIKGFALTLITGIVSSMFTSLFMTRFFFAGWVQNPEHKELKMLRLFGVTSINFLKKSRLAITLSAILMLIGALFFFQQRHTIFGMDFTGGYSLTVSLQEKPQTNYRLAATKALTQQGIHASDFHIQELNKANQLRIQLSTRIDQMEKGGETPVPAAQALFPYQENPHITWIIDSLAKEGLEIQPASLPSLHLNWTAMSGQLSTTMRNQALFGLLLALLCILVYITFRFEFKYAISATIGLVHDILITVGLLAIGHALFPSIRIDLQAIAALMTIVGYSLNDTIIIFDRIREDMRHMRKVSFSEIINHALNATLSRTVMTSGTTLLVLCALVFFGGASIFNFALIMFLGIFIGTLSSLYIAAPMLLYFHRKEVARQEQTISSRQT